MGTRSYALLAVLLSARVAGAEEGCRELDKRSQWFTTCFDPGNRLILGGGTSGVDAGIALRHVVSTDDPGITWRFEHDLLRTRGFVDRTELAVYSGRFLRHSRDGHLVLPTSTPHKIFLPFDVGAEAAVGRFRGRMGSNRLNIDVVRAVALFDLARSGDFRRRLSLGTVVEWDMRVDMREGFHLPRIVEHDVSPFSVAELALYLEDRRGLTLAALTFDAGTVWSDEVGWHRRLVGEASVERVFIAVNDRPISIYLSGRWSEDEGVLGEAGLRFGLISRSRAR